MTPEEMARLYRSGYSTHRIGERETSGEARCDCDYNSMEAA